MQVFLLRDSKGMTVHASENKKRTGCGISLVKPENMAKFTVSGTVDDALSLMTEVTCEKCQTVFTKRMLKADRKEMNRQLKEQKKLGGNDDANMVSLAEVQEQRRKKEALEAQKAAEAEKRAAERQAASSAPAAAPAPVQERNTDIPSRAVKEPDLPVYEEYTPPPKQAAPAAAPAPAAPSFPGFSLDSDLAQFALPKTAVDPTAAAFAANEGKNPNILAQNKPTPAKQPVLDNPEDIMAQFAIPETAKPAPAAVEEPAAADITDIDDLMAQFSLPEAPAPKAPTAPAADEDIMAQFSLPEAPAPEAPVAPAADEDIMAQFSLPEAPAPESPTAPAADEDIMAQFSLPEAPAPEAPTAPAAEAEVVLPSAPTMEDFTDTTSTVLASDMQEFDAIADRMFGSHHAPKAAEEPDEVEVVSEVVISEATLLDSPILPKAAPVVDTVLEENAPIETEVEEIPEVPTLSAPSVEETLDEIPEVPSLSAPSVEETLEEIPEVPTLSAPSVEEALEEIPEVPTLSAPSVEETPDEIPEVPTLSAPSVEPQQAAVAAGAMMAQSAYMQPTMQTIPQPQTVQQPMQGMSQAQMQQPMQGMPQTQMLQQPMQNVQLTAQFMGYDAQGQPVYTYVQQPVMPQFMGYDAQGQPVYAQAYAAPIQQTPVLQSMTESMPVQSPVPQPMPTAAPVPQPAPVSAPTPAPAPEPEQSNRSAALISPMTAAPTVPSVQGLPEDVEAPVLEPMYTPKPKKNRGTSGVHVSTIQQNEMPDVIRSAVAKSAAPQGNIFDQQDSAIPVLDSVVDILSQMGEDTSSFKPKDEPELNLDFQEYKPKKKKAASSQSGRASEASSKENAQRQKRQEKIDAKFKKDLAKRGF